MNLNSCGSIAKLLCFILPILAGSLTGQARECPSDGACPPAAKPTQAWTRTVALQAAPIPHPPVAGGWLAGVAWDGRAWLVVGGRGSILRSEDGFTWERQLENTEVCFRSVLHGKGRWLTLSHCSTVFLSQDGVRWEPRRTPGPQLRSMAFGAGVFVAVGEAGAIVVSSDAESWPPARTVSVESLLCVRYADATFVAVGNRGAVSTSPDGRQWTQRVSGTTRRLHGLVHGNGRWVAVGAHGAIVSSPDGIHWVLCDSGTEETLNAVAFGGGTFLAVGRNGCTRVSADACEWQGLPAAAANLCDVAFGRDRFIAIGDADTLVSVGAVTVAWNPRTVSARGNDLTPGHEAR